MQSSPGLCRNVQGCELARSGQLVSIPLYNAFVCPNCGAQLASPPLPSPPRRTRRHVVLAAILLAGVGAGAAAWWNSGDRRVVVTLATAKLRAAPPALSAPALAPPPILAVAASDTPDEAAPGPAPETPAAGPMPPAAMVAKAAPATGAPEGRFNPVPLTGGAPAYPAALAADGRPGSVRVACTIAPDGAPRGCTAKVGRGGKLFPPVVLAWLAQKPRFRPISRHGHPVTERVHWRVAVAESPQALRDARLAANPPAQLRQPASLLAVGSTHPVFPDQFYESDWMGSVTVDCLIGADGQASACHATRKEGSTRFEDAVLDWLRNPRTRFQPATSNGHAVPARRVWQVGFTP